MGRGASLAIRERSPRRQRDQRPARRQSTAAAAKLRGGGGCEVNRWLASASIALTVGGNRLDDFRRNLGTAPGPASVTSTGAPIQLPATRARRHLLRPSRRPGRRTRPQRANPASRFATAHPAGRRGAPPVRDRSCPRRPLPTSTCTQMDPGGLLVARSPTPAAPSVSLNSDTPQARSPRNARPDPCPPRAGRHGPGNRSQFLTGLPRPQAQARRSAPDWLAVASQGRAVSPMSFWIE